MDDFPPQADDAKYYTPRRNQSLGVPETLEHLRTKMESVATDFATGRINRAQFNAIYAHYNEQRMLVERLYQRNPETEIWRHAAASGHTGFLRSHFEARPLFYIIFRHRAPNPIMQGGQEPPEVGRQIGNIVKTVWRMEKIPSHGLARKAVGDGRWLVMALGENALTVVVFSLQPSAAQHDLVRDLHNDFERANRLSLERELSAEKMVFPQRALLA